MKLTIQLPDAMHADILAVNERDGRLDQVEIEPVFYSSKERKTVLILNVNSSDGSTLSRAVITVSGSTGEIRLKDCTNKVAPEIDSQLESGKP